MTVDGRLHVDPSHALEGAHVEGVHADQLPGGVGLDVAIAELRTEALQEPDLLGGQLDPALLGVLLEAQQALVLGQQVVAAPDAADPAGADLDPLQGQLLRHPQAAQPWVGASRQCARMAFSTRG